MDALSPLGMVSDNPSDIHTESCAVAQKDYFVEKDGVKFQDVTLAWWGSQSNIAADLKKLIDQITRK